MAKQSSAPQERIHKLNILYDEIWNWGRQKYDPAVTKRRIDAVDPLSHLFIVGEAYAQNQVRSTGINWFSQKGEIGPAGKQLDLILRCIGYTVYPPDRLAIDGNHIKARESHLQTAYTTDIFPCYPPNGKAPTTQMLRDAQTQGFLKREIEIVQPKAILLLGQHAYRTFYEAILSKQPHLPKITDAFHALAPGDVLDNYLGVFLIPFMHPSPQNGHFQKWFKSVRNSLCDQPQVQAIAAAIGR